jgi:hypothetical protein
VEHNIQTAYFLYLRKDANGTNPKAVTPKHTMSSQHPAPGQESRVNALTALRKVLY